MLVHTHTLPKTSEANVSESPQVKRFPRLIHYPCAPRDVRAVPRRCALKAKQDADTSQHEATNVIAHFEAQQRAQVEAQAVRDNEARALAVENELCYVQLWAEVERENAHRQQELETQRQQHLQVAQAARDIYEEAEKLAQEKLVKTERKKQEAKGETVRVTRTTEVNRRKVVVEEARKSFEAKRLEEQLPLLAMRMMTGSRSPRSPSSSLPDGKHNCASCCFTLQSTQKFFLKCRTKAATVTASVFPVVVYYCASAWADTYVWIVVSTLLPTSHQELPDLLQVSSDGSPHSQSIRSNEIPQLQEAGCMLVGITSMREDVKKAAAALNLSNMRPE
ncbi:Hypothetical protein PHPALM_4700 [Phytophthora palmivora]|uniref:Uncharacterized protein n=1 Tax=Phytophthora palmivora TaxID=4796 RepID=A0A2P4YJ74_9STRA|nr:Hypothetical protein PHPALM_4700 [Phytophthora palmivora]